MTLSIRMLLLALLPFVIAIEVMHGWRLLAMTDITAQAAIAAVVTVSIGYMQFRTQRSIQIAADKAAEKVLEVKVATERAAVEVSKVKAAAQQAAAKVSEVKDTLEANTADTHERLEKISAVTDATHMLVNGAMSGQLKLNSDLSAWKADQTGKQDDRDAATAAKKKYEDHISKEAN